MLNQYGYPVKNARSDAKYDPHLETPYARRRFIEELVKRRPVRRCEVAKLAGISTRQASRILNELSLMMPIAPDEKGWWKCLS